MQDRNIHPTPYVIEHVRPLSADDPQESLRAISPAFDNPDLNYGEEGKLKGIEIGFNRLPEQEWSVTIKPWVKHRKQIIRVLTGPLGFKPQNGNVKGEPIVLVREKTGGTPRINLWKE